jgi:hypothetical protein
MKKLEKVDLFERMENELQILQEHECRMVSGGAIDIPVNIYGSGIDGLCVFNCLTYLSGLFGCGYDI